MIKRWLMIFALLGPLPLSAAPKKEILRVAYFNPIFGHVHRNPSRYSSSLTTISCGHPIKVLKLVPAKGRPVTVFNKVWHFVKVGPYEGYIDGKYLNEKKPNCFQDRYPKYFDALELDLTELYYWGRLYDQYVFGKSRVK
jgi:hypothetical protein